MFICYKRILFLWIFIELNYYEWTTAVWRQGKSCAETIDGDHFVIDLYIIISRWMPLNHYYTSVHHHVSMVKNVCSCRSLFHASKQVFCLPHIDGLTYFQSNSVTFCRWDFDEMTLADSHSGDMNPPLVMLHMEPKMDFTPEEADYIAPLYKTALRAGTLSTTGTLHMPLCLICAS